MAIYETICDRRTIRKFRQKPISKENLCTLVNAARLAPSGSNLQPLKYRVVSDKAEVDGIFPFVHWASFIAPKGNPEEGERPVAYIAVCADTAIKKQGYETDAGAAVENLLLAAWEMGIGCCWMGAIDRKKIAAVLGIDTDRYPIHTLVALGYRAERPIAVPLQDSIKYFKDKNGVLNVPKRSLEDILLD